MIAVIRIIGQCSEKKKTLETLKRLKLGKKYTTRLIDPTDKIRMGMIESIKESVMYGEISDDLVKEMKEKRGKEGKDVFFLHPPRGGFKKSTKMMRPKGILGKNPDTAKYIGKML